MRASSPILLDADRDQPERLGRPDEDQLNGSKYAKMKLVQVAYGEESEQINQQQALASSRHFPTSRGSLSRRASDLGRRSRARAGRAASAR